MSFCPFVSILRTWSCPPIGKLKEKLKKAKSPSNYLTLIIGCVIDWNWEGKTMKKKKAQKNNTNKRDLKELTPAQLKKIGGGELVRGPKRRDDYSY